LSRNGSCAQINAVSRTIVASWVFMKPRSDPLGHIRTGLHHCTGWVPSELRTVYANDVLKSGSVVRAGNHLMQRVSSEIRGASWRRRRYASDRLERRVPVDGVHQTRSCAPQTTFDAHHQASQDTPAFVSAGTQTSQRRCVDVKPSPISRHAVFLHHHADNARERVTTTFAWSSNHSTNKIRTGKGA